MLSKYFTIILILFAFLRDIVRIYSYHLRLFLVVYFVELYLLESNLSIIVISLKTGYETISIGLESSHQNYIDKR